MWASIILNNYDDETELSDVEEIAKKIDFKYSNELHNLMQAYMNEGTDYKETKKKILDICAANN